MLFRLLIALAATMLLSPVVVATVAASSQLDNALPVPSQTNLSLKQTVSTEWLNVSSAGYVQTADGTSFSQHDKISREWKGMATVELYIGSKVLNNVGYIVGPMMYNMIQHTLRVDCPDTIGGRSNHKCWSMWHPFDTRYRKDDGGFDYTLLQVHVKSSNYKNMQVRNLLIGAIAAAYEESTKLTRNCYYVNDPESGYRYCNAPIQVAAYTEDSHMFVIVTSDISGDNDGSWHCCETRERIDTRLDELMGEFRSVYPTPRSKERNVDCYLGCADNDRESNTHVDMLLIDLMNSGM